MIFNLSGAVPTPDGMTNSTDLLDGAKPHKNLDEEYIGIIIGALAALILLLFGIILLIIIRHRKNKYNNNHRTMKPIEPRNVAVDLSDIRIAANGKVSNGNMYNFVATSEGESDREGACCTNAKDCFGGEPSTTTGAIQNRKLPDLPPTPDSSGTGRSHSRMDQILNACFLAQLGDGLLCFFLSNLHQFYLIFLLDLQFIYL